MGRILTIKKRSSHYSSNNKSSYNNKFDSEETKYLIELIEFMFDLNRDLDDFNIFIGEQDSLLKEYQNLTLKKHPHYIIKPSQLVDDMSFSSIIGSAPGYVGSNESSNFIKFLDDNKKNEHYIIIDGLNGVDPNKLDTLLSFFKDKQIIDRTNNIKDPISLEKSKVIINYYKDIKKTNDEDLKNLLSFEETVNNSKNVKIFNDNTILTKSRIKHFYSYRTNINEVIKLNHLNEKLNIKKLELAINEFHLSNKLITSLIYDKFNIMEKNSQRYLIYEDKYMIAKKYKISESTSHQFLKKLEDNYFGQELAIKYFVKAILLKAMGIKKTPVSLLCTGPPGVGKTELAKKLGEVIPNFNRIDANLITNKEKLFGSYLERGLLFKNISPYSANIILIDEVEKLNYDTLMSLLQIIDEGIANDLHNNITYNLNNTIFVFTSNIIKEFSEDISELTLLLKSKMPEEFVDRIDYITPFRKFTIDEKVQIAQYILKRDLSEVEMQKLESAESFRDIKKIINDISIEASFNKILNKFTDNDRLNSQ